MYKYKTYHKPVSKLFSFELMMSSFLLCIHVCGMHAYLCGWMYVPVYVEVNVSMWMSFWMIFPEGAPWIYSLLIQLVKLVSFLVPAFHSILTNNFKYPVSVSRVLRLHECWDTHLLKVMLEFQISVLSLRRQEIYHYAFFPEPSIFQWWNREPFLPVFSI